MSAAESPFDKREWLLIVAASAELARSGPGYRIMFAQDVRDARAAGITGAEIRAVTGLDVLP